MMRWIVASSIKLRFIVVALAAGMMLYGFTQLRNTPVDVFPEFAPPQVEIQTISLGLSSTDVESLVTVPLEQALNGVPGLDDDPLEVGAQTSRRSSCSSSPGPTSSRRASWSQERVRDVTPTLPTWAAPPVMMPPVSATRRVMHIGMTSDSVSLIDMSTTAYWKIRARLLRVPGVANVAIWGERLQQQHVQVDPEEAPAAPRVARRGHGGHRGLARRRAAQVLGRSGHRDRRASSRPRTSELDIRHILPIVSPRGPRQGGRSRSAAATTIVLGDVAKLLIDHQPLVGDAVINDGPGLLLVVEKFPWGNTLEVTRGRRGGARRDATRPSRDRDRHAGLPAGELRRRRDPQPLPRRCSCGVLLMMLVLIVFLFDWRSALISAVTIPLSLTAAGLVLYLRGVTINTMILAGFVIALGGGRRRRDRRLREHRAAPAHPSQGRATTVRRRRRRRSSSRRRSRCAARSSTRR